MDDSVNPFYASHTNGHNKGFDYRYPLHQPPSPGASPYHRRRCICCSLCIGLTLLTLSIASLLIYFLVQPRAPKYTIQNASISQFNLSTQHQLTSNLHFTISARNPNKKIGIFYDNVNVVASYEGIQIGQGSIKPFYQGHKNTTLASLYVRGRDVALEEVVGSDLKKVLANKSSLAMRLKVISHVRIKIGLLKSWSKKIKVICDVTLSSPSARKTQVLSKNCHLKKL